MQDFCVTCISNWDHFLIVSFCVLNTPVMCRPAYVFLGKPLFLKQNLSYIVLITRNDCRALVEILTWETSMEGEHSLHHTYIKPRLCVSDCYNGFCNTKATEVAYDSWTVLTGTKLFIDFSYHVVSD